MVLFRFLIYGFMLSTLIAACRGLKRMLPEGPVLTTKERQTWLDQPRHKVDYTGEPKVVFPLVPLQVWAATYELDLILVSKHPDWNMHEYAQLATPEGMVWLMKDAEEGTLNQSITADLDNIQAWLPELPVERNAYPVKVVDNSTDRHLDVQFEYQNSKGVDIVATYQGKRPKTKLSKQNGSTMGHSREQLLVALHLPKRDFGKKATIQYNGKAYKMDKLLGLVPFQMALEQTQGGASSGQLIWTGSRDKLSSTHPKKGESIDQVWSIQKEKEGTIVRQKSPLRELVYEFEGTDTLCLKVAYAQQWNKSVPGARFEFAPALPDLRRPFNGRYTSNFVLDIEGQHNNAQGTITAEWVQGQVKVMLTPTNPWWVTDRPMCSLLTFLSAEKVQVDIEMLPVSRSISSD